MAAWPFQENTPPQVQITTPRDKDRFQWNSRIPYEIVVSDREDGHTEYREIPENEVFMVISYVADSTLANQQLKNEIRPGLEVLSRMGRSNCFSCHRQRENLIGPSFERIARRYGSQAQKTDSLVKRVIHGSLGRWGDQQMPAQTGLETAEVQEMVRWILENGLNTDVQYIPGTKGAFQSRSKPGTQSRSTGYALRAYYRDHGQAGIPGSSRIGTHTIIMHPDTE